VPPLELEPQRLTTQQPVAQAAQGKLLIDHGRRTNIQGRRPGLKVKTASSETTSIEPTASPYYQQNTVTQDMQETALPHEASATMYPEAAASTHIHHPGPLPRRQPTPTQEKPRTTAKADSPRGRPQEGCDVDAVVARFG
jgi:hypothetical protein